VLKSIVGQRLRAFLRLTSLMFLLSCLMLLLSTRGFYVYGSCMEPNLKNGERVLASRFSYWFGSPQRGDVVIFRSPSEPEKNFVKRVIGLPGDRVEIRRGQLYINGRTAPEPYKQIKAHGDYGPERVQPDHLFVLGDNRDRSNDSRFWGELPLQNVEAKAVLCYWPLSRAHLLE
jgi:signal peptidase I